MIYTFIVQSKPLLNILHLLHALPRLIPRTLLESLHRRHPLKPLLPVLPSLPGPNLLALPLRVPHVFQLPLLLVDPRAALADPYRGSRHIPIQTPHIPLLPIPLECLLQHAAAAKNRPAVGEPDRGQLGGVGVQIEPGLAVLLPSTASVVD